MSYTCGQKSKETHATCIYVVVNLATEPRFLSKFQLELQRYNFFCVCAKKKETAGDKACLVKHALSSKLCRLNI